MKVIVFGHREDETQIYEQENRYGFAFTFTPETLTLGNVAMTNGFDAVFIIVSCVIDEAMALRLAENGVRYVLTRAAGKDHLDVEAIRRAGLRSAYVPVYSPNSIAEHTVLLVLELLRKRKQQTLRLQSGNLTLQGLRGCELRNRTVGVVGTGRIGLETMRDLSGFGCRMLAYDQRVSPEGEAFATYVGLDELLATSDVVLLHCPLLPQNRHMIDARALERFKPGALLVNTARGGLVDAQAVLEALMAGRLGGYAFDVYEFENQLKRVDHQGQPWGDEVLRQLIALPNVVFTNHIAFYTDEAVTNMIGISIRNLYQLQTTGACANET